MLKYILFCGLASALSVTAVELPPYLPPAGDFRRVETVPAESVVISGEKSVGDFIVKRSLNGIWKFSGIGTSANPFAAEPELEKKYASPAFDASGWGDIKVPLNWYVAFPEKQTTAQPYARGFYRTAFELSKADLEKRRVMLEFDTVGYDAKVFLNGIEIGTHHGDFTPFKLDATAAAKEGMNLLAVRALSDNGTVFGVPGSVRHAYGSQWAIHNIKGGIWQDVRLSLEPEIRIDRIFVVPDLARSAATADCRIVNPGKSNLTLTVAGRVVSAIKGENITAGTSAPQKIVLKPGVNDISLVVPLESPTQWSVDAPYLYHFVLSLADGGRVVSAAAERFGYREFKCENGKFFLNGKNIYLFGENISSVFYGGFGETAAADEKQFEQYILGHRNNGCVILRNAHMPILPAALRIADECGMMIYSEWAWCFNNNIDAEEFGKNNLKELEEFFRSTANHPSVVMWSLGNEVLHQNLPVVVRELNRQVRLIRSLDKQKRPICTFSGVGSWKSYGENRLDTDLLDSHCYTALSLPWTKFVEEQKEWCEGNLRIYGKPMPMIAWENVGFSWGYFTDESYRPGTVEAYSAYAVKQCNWGTPNGIGFTGTAPLWKALRADFPSWAMGHYGRRIFELYRLDPNFAGFSPWFGRSLAMARLWTQPVLPSLRNENGLFPRNLFAGGKSEWTLTVVNGSGETVDALNLDVEMAAEQDGQLTKVAAFPVGKAAPGEQFATRVKLALPETLAPGHYQMRLTLRDGGGKEAGRNFYDIFLENTGILTEPVTPAVPVCVFDTGAEPNVVLLEKALNDHRIPFRRIVKAEEAADGALVVVPAEITAKQSLVIGNDPAFGKFVSERGGTLLVLAQKSVKSPLPGSELLAPIGNTFVDLVIPDHPAFAGLDYRCFDTWNNPEYGFVASANYQPFNLNAVAVKGPMLGRQDIGMVFVEAVNGKGRIILSQFNATACRGIDSVAARFFRNLLSYAAGKERWAAAKALVDPALADYRVDPERLFYIDLAAKANMGFRDETADDGKGGWTDQGNNDFRMMPTGIQTVAGVSFDIIDPAKNNGKSCLVLRGTNRPRLAAAIRGIEVNRKLSRLFFLHTAAWGDMGKAGAYRIHHADKTFTDCVIEGGVNIGDWWTPARLSEAKLGILRENSAGHEVGTFVAEWENPKPHLAITAIDFLSAASARGNAIDYLPTGTPVPVLIAVTGEKAENLRRLTGECFKAARGIMETGGEIPAEVETVKEKDGVSLKVGFKASPPREIPAVILVYDREQCRGDFRYLTFRARSRKSGIIQFLIPRDDHMAMLRGDVTLRSDGEWHKYRLEVGETFGNEGGFSFDSQRGELFIFYRSQRMPDVARPAFSFEIKDIAFE